MAFLFVRCFRTTRLARRSVHFYCWIAQTPGVSAHDGAPWRGQHPHRGFETVTIVYEGEVAHRDSTGEGGVIGVGDVQWMTAAGGILHEEYHSEQFAKTGGVFNMVQLWVNLPAADKMSVPRYQAIAAADIPVAALENHAGTLRVIAGDYKNLRGAAHTFSPMQVWDITLQAGAEITLPAQVDWNTLLVALQGAVIIDGKHCAAMRSWRCWIQSAIACKSRQNLMRACCG